MSGDTTGWPGEAGIKVLRFSVGFGKPLWKKVGKDGVEYTIAAIPLGGYVKMLDEREGPVAPEEKQQSFNSKSVWARMAVVAAGPAANFILAILLLWGVYIYGVQTSRPVVRDVAPDSIVASAGLESGDQIISVDGNPVSGWEEVNLALAARIGDSGVITIEAQGADDAKPEVHQLTIDSWPEPEPGQMLPSLGFTSFGVLMASKVYPDSPAAEAGLQDGDLIASIQGEPILFRSNFVEIIQNNAEQNVVLGIERNKQTMELVVRPRLVTIEDSESVRIGVLLANGDVYKESYGFAGALSKSLNKTWDLIKLSGNMLVKLVTGKVSVKNLGGPVSIAEGAGQTARAGIVQFVVFLAFISINLGFINLLPIPVLDGGHLLYCVIELFKGSPPSERFQELGLRIGVVLVVCIMVVAVVNDIMRL